jgi:hypothetical protein
LSLTKSTYLKGTVIIILLFGHFTISYFYTAPDKLNNAELELASGNYMKPYFHQHWNLFAPEPPLNNVKVSASVDGGVTWRNLSEEILEQHYTWRISHHGRIALAFGNAALYAAYEWEMASTSDSQVEETKSRDFLKVVCRKYIGVEENAPIEVKMEIKPIKRNQLIEVVY